MHSWQRGEGDFYDDNDNEDDDNGDDDEGDHHQWQQIGRWRNHDGNDLVFMQQPTLVDCIPGRGGGGWFLQWWWQWGWQSMMMTMRMTTMATTMRETIANDDDNNNKVTSMAMISFFRQQPTLVGCIADRGGGWVISTMMMTMRMTTMVTTMRTTIAVSSFRRCYQCSQWQWRQ